MVTRVLRVFILFMFLASMTLHSQVLINEDFSTVTGTTPPTGWVNNDINSSGELWTFANPGTRTLNTPISSPAAIFDSDFNGSGGAEDAALESPAFDASVGTIVLSFDHYFQSGFGGSYAVEVFDGTSWDTIIMGGGSSTTDPQSESLDITALAGNSAVAQVRFHWQGNYSWYWILDNVKVEIVSCLDPSALGATNKSATGADLFWTSGGASNWDVEYGPAGFTPGTGTLINATNDTISVGSLTAATAYEFYVQDSCGVGNVSGWAGPFSFTTNFNPPAALSCASAVPTMIFTEEFDAVNGWTGDINSGNDSWEIPGAPTSSNTGPNSEHSGPAGSFMNFEASNTSVSTGQVVSPAIDLTQAMTDAELSFWMHAYGANMGRLTVGVGTSATGPFTEVFTWAGEYQTDENDPWVNIGADLSGYLGQTIYIQFHQLDSVSGFTGDMSIDLVEVSACVSCAAPTMLGATNVTSTSADIYWATGGASAWNIEYGASGFVLGSGTMMNSMNDTLALSGLTQVTYYDFYVRDSCAVGDVSSWSGPYTFLTPCPATLSGTYTINGVMPTGGNNYNTFADAAIALNNCGISAAVTFNVQSGLYVDQLHLNGVSGTSVTNTITFNGTGGDTLVWDGTGEQGTVIVENTSHVTLQNMLIANTATSEAWGVLLINNSDTVTIDNCVIAMDSTSSSTDICGVLVSSSYDNDLTEGADVDGLTVRNSLIVGGYYAMNFEGVSTGIPSLNYTVTGNVIRKFNIAGLYVDEIENLTISGNTIESLRGSCDGLYMFDLNNYVVEGNTINVTDYALYITDGNDGFTPSSNSKVVNNMITSTADYGIYLNDCESTDVFHNSVVGEPAFRINDQIGLDARNNIFTSIGDFAFESDDDLGAGDVVDYNIYYSTGANPFDVGTGGVYADLVAWQAGDATKNVNSQEGDPQFTSSTDLHVLGTLPNNIGDASAGVLVDIDSEVRSGTTPDIGADEYTPASCTPSSGLVANLTYADSATVSWSAGPGSLFNLEYGPMGFARGTGTTVTGIVDTFYTITGLIPATYYDFYIQDDCGAGDTSFWAGPGNFATGCATFMAPRTESFDQASTPLCWSQSATSGGPWVFGAGFNSVTCSAATDHTGNGGTYAWMDQSSGDAGVILEMNDIDVSALATPAIEFYYWMCGTSYSPTNATVVESWDGANWNIVDSIDIATSGWQRMLYDLTGHTYGSNLVKIRFRAESGGHTSDFYGDNAIDDITVDDYQTLLCSTPLMAPYTESFDANATPACWSQSATSGGPWLFSTGSGVNASNCSVPADHTGNAGHFTWMDQSSADAGVILQMPVVDISALTVPYLDLYYWMCGVGYTPANKTYIETYDGTNWSVFDSIVTATNGWENMGYDLTAAVYNTNLVQVRFRAESGGNTSDFYGDNVMDDISIIEAPTCFAASALGATNLGTSTADIFWTTGGAANWNVEYGLAGFTPGTGTMMAAANDTIGLTGLNNSSSYEFYVQDSCAVGDVGIWVGPYTFNTLCGPIAVFPWLETFEASTTSIPNCWFNDTADDADWIFRSGSIGHGATTDNTLGTALGYYAGLDDSHSSTTDTLNNLVTPELDLNLLTNPRLNFFYYIGNDNVLTSTLYIDVFDGTFWNMAVATISFTQAGWLQQFVDLTPYKSGVSKIRFRGVETTDFNSDISIDDVMVEETPSCPDPSALGSFNATQSTADIYWTMGSNGATSIVEYGITGFTPGTGTTVISTNDTITLTSLSAITTYDFCVTDSCGVGDVSNTVCGTFTTALPATSCVPFTSNVPNDTICAPGLTGFASNMGSSVVYLDTASGRITNAGDTLRISTNADTTLSLIEATPTSITGHVGPFTSIATTGFGNFSNGQWISILDTVRIDSMTVQANGIVEANLRVFTDDPALGGTLVQRGKTFTTGSATGDYQVPVGTVLLPGSYFINVEFTGGAGQLFRATGGASYPYVLPGLMSIDSTNFSSQVRIYYTFDLVATKVCLGAPVTATSYIRGLSAGSDQSLIMCDNGSSEDLTTYLSQDADLGGTFVSSNASAAITGNMFDPSVLTTGTYQVYYTTVATVTCPSDSALFTIEVQACLSCAGLTTPTLTPDTICGSGVVNLMATQSGTDIVWFNPQNRVEGYGTTLSTTISATTQFVAQAILSSGPSITAGPPQSLSVNAYPTANFTNGQYIRVAQDVRIDSAVFAVNGPLDFVVAIQDAQRTDTLQVSNLISFTAGDTAAKEIGIYLSAGTYFINTIPVNGTGILWRPTAGANFPYGAPNILSVDSSDFGPTRLYYLYDMKVSAACLSVPDSTFGVIVSGTNAGTSDSVSVCGSNTMVDLSSYLGSFDMGGTWYDDDASGAMSAAGIFDASMVNTGVYNFTYALPAASGCPGDSATITVTVASPNTAGMDTTASACTSQTALPLRPLLPGSAAGGSWIDVDNSGALVGNTFFVSGVAVGTYRFTYYTAAGICPADSATVTVVVSAGVSAGVLGNDTVCNDAGLLDLNTLLDANATTGGTWKDVSTSGGLTGSMFDPAAVVAGQSYTLRYVVSNACGMDSAEVSLYVEDCTVGLKDYVASNLVMYPNPTSGNLTIEMTGENMKDMNVQVYGLGGKLLISSEFEDTKKATIDLTTMPKGVYTIKVFTNRGIVVRQVTKM